MYLPDAFKTSNYVKAIEFIENHSFGDLVTYNNSLCSNKVPFFFDGINNALYGHFSRANPQLSDIESSGEVLAIFSGPQTYISPLWYHRNDMVPTWNFQTLQVRGEAAIVNDDCLIEILEKLSTFHEANSPTPWNINTLSTEKLDLMLRMIAGFKIEIKEIRFKEKMSQNRETRDQLSIISSLEKADNSNAMAVANIMRSKL